MGGYYNLKDTAYSPDQGHQSMQGEVTTHSTTSVSPYPVDLTSLTSLPRQTLADERSLIQKESAAIRTSFKEEDSFTRHNNIAKLLYIHMLGYPAHFGQIECLKLVASPRFSDKRLGYLGIMLLLDENQEVLMLVTNSLKNDMNHSNMYAVGLALCTFANISSEEMSRDLCNEIEKLLGSSNTYIRKKAALCAIRVIRRVPDLMDHFLEKAKSLLHDRNHGVLLAGVTLVNEMCEVDDGVCGEFKKPRVSNPGSLPFVAVDGDLQAVPLLVKHLKSLVTTGYSPEHDVGGITDPFLQVKILRLLRHLGQGDTEASEAMNDILAQVATNTDSTKNVGNAILYETVLTILEIESDSGLRVMAINILGKFLGNRDNNIRYVALNTLNKVALSDNAVQRHRDVVLSCLSDGDVSIRRRALELSYALINDQNIRIMMRELLAFLEVADNDFKSGLTTQISLAAERFAPNRRWHIDTVLRTLTLAGNYVREEVLAGFIRLVCHTAELQAYTAQRLYHALREDISQESLTLATVWIVGEFGDALLQSGASVDDGEQVKEINASDIVDLFQLVLDSPYANTLIRQWSLMALAKLAIRFAEAGTSSASVQQERIREILAGYSDATELEIQQRAVEFGQLFTKAEVIGGVLEHMPAPELKATIMGTGEWWSLVEADSTRAEKPSTAVSEKRKVGSTRVDKDSLVDLMGDELPSANGSSTPTSALDNFGSSQNTQDLLADIFGSSTMDAPPAAPAVKPQNAMTDIMSLFGNSAMSPQSTGASGSSQPPAHDILSSLGVAPRQANQTPPTPTPAPVAASQPPQKPSLQSYTAYDKKGLKITLTPKANPAQPGMVQVLARFTASEGGVKNVNFQAAVPKTQQLQMLAMSNGDIPPGATETQQMRIIAPPGAQVRLRLRISFSKADSGDAVQEQVDFAGFPAGLTLGQL
ncbi:hypothetical protein QFC21_005312 [Naganishia friedmannii]|uniref:Uncharacterized protein n=1 Tax=Naganishia friedmannii TaxID=89922 RepID=A0ACC2V9C1_9TREE|nr:hypothetical protein QFC21_005312 [Naganishia friedmannii]